MDQENERLNVDLNEIWRACRKIQGSIFQHGINIWDEYRKYDPNENGLVSESVFGNVLGKYKCIIGLSEYEITEITDYFRQRDGRVAYDQFCRVICEEGQDHSKNKDLVTGLEWADPMHVNVVSDADKRNLCLLFLKIAEIVRARDIKLMPYFQDYELIAKNVGTVTVAHFSRVFHFMKIILSENDFLLILRRYMKNSYTVNYVAFIKHLEAVLKYLHDNRLLNNTQELIKNFPGRIIDLELSQLPNVNLFKLNCKMNIVETGRPQFSDCEVFLRIQRHVYENRIRIHEFFETFDPLRTGTITKEQFRRGLDSIGLSGLDRLYLTEREIEKLCIRYRDDYNKERVRWRFFEDDVDRVFTEKLLHTKPTLVVESPPIIISELPKIGEAKWEEQTGDTLDLCEKAMLRIQRVVRNRRIYFHPFFKDYDKLNSGHVSRTQAEQVLKSHSVFLSTGEINALKRRYCDDMGFNYIRFLEDADPAEYAIPKLQSPLQPKREVKPTKECLKRLPKTEHDIVKALANVKKQAAVKSINIGMFLRDYDRHREGFILEVDFRRGIDAANIKLSPEEINIICELFQSKKRGCCVNYLDFCKSVQEVFVQDLPHDLKLLTVPLKHMPVIDCFECFLNFEERTIASKALTLLARKPDEISNLQALFTDFDKPNCGTITQNQFLRALTVRDMHNMISRREFETVCKCFGVNRGMRLEFDYRAFLNILDIIYSNNRK